MLTEIGQFFAQNSMLVTYVQIKWLLSSYVGDFREAIIDAGWATEHW